MFEHLDKPTVKIKVKVHRLDGENWGYNITGPEVQWELFSFEVKGHPYPEWNGVFKLRFEDHGGDDDGPDDFIMRLMSTHPDPYTFNAVWSAIYRDFIREDDYEFYAQLFEDEETGEPISRKYKLKVY